MTQRLFDGDRPPSRAPRSRRYLSWWSHGRTLALATLVVAAAVPTQAVLSQVPDERTSQAEADPDCLPPDQAAQSPEKRDGVCPEAGDGANPSPGPEAKPEPPPEQKPPAPKPETAGVAGADQRPAAQKPPTEVASEVTGEVGEDRVSGRARRKASRRGERHRGGRRGVRRGSSRRATRRRRAGRRHGRGSHTRDGVQRRRHGRRGRHASGRRTLGPIPAWARSLLTRPLPDPLPAGKRLDPGFARILERATARHEVSWPLLLAILRARGHEGAVPATRAEVRALAGRLVELGASRHPTRAIGALSSASGAADPTSGIGASVGFADRVLALAAYNRAVGLRGLVRGLEAVKPALIERVLGSRRLGLYRGGRADVRAGRIDGRVLVLLLYMAHRHRAVTVSSLQTGHGFFTKSGNVSNHSFGRAVDISALEGVSIMGNQDAGGVTERALRNILLLPEALRPSELISLFEMGGPSFAMADHADHFHVGF